MIVEKLRRRSDSAFRNNTYRTRNPGTRMETGKTGKTGIIAAAFGVATVLATIHLRTIIRCRLAIRIRIHMRTRSIIARHFRSRRSAHASQRRYRQYQGNENQQKTVITFIHVIRLSQRTGNNQWHKATIGQIYLELTAAPRIGSTGSQNFDDLAG